MLLMALLRGRKLIIPVPLHGIRPTTGASMNTMSPRLIRAKSGDSRRQVSEAAFTETYTFYTNSDDGIRLWVDGRQLINNWTAHATTENRGRIDLVAGQTYGFVLEYFEDSGSAVVDLSWESPRTPKQLIPQAALSLPLKARDARPSNGAGNVRQNVILKWDAGEAAASHQVYFGADEEAVKNADTGSPDYKRAVELGA